MHQGAALRGHRPLNARRCGWHRPWALHRCAQPGRMRLALLAPGAWLWGAAAHGAAGSRSRTAIPPGSPRARMLLRLGRGWRSGGAAAYGAAGSRSRTAIPLGSPRARVQRRLRRGWSCWRRGCTWCSRVTARGRNPPWVTPGARAAAASARLVRCMEPWVGHITIPPFQPPQTGRHGLGNASRLVKLRASLAEANTRPPSCPRPGAAECILELPGHLCKW